MPNIFWAAPHTHLQRTPHMVFFHKGDDCKGCELCWIKKVLPMCHVPLPGHSLPINWGDLLGFIGPILHLWRIQQPGLHLHKSANPNQGLCCAV